MRRVLPLALLFLAGSAIADGQAVYQKSCVACHLPGAANAPKLGDKAAWAPLIAKGVPELLATVKKGKNAMPPQAGCAACTDDELTSAIEYMISTAR